ncbi:MAG: hypothetical protein PF693_04990 [Spirochaetia bacterium]|jgi:hypothetical protein|nr:hypothetical protein [Spirochaetia bacterium]
MEEGKVGIMTEIYGKLYKITEQIIFILILVLVPSFMYGQVVLTNPGIPEKETIIYTQDTEGKLETVKSVIEYKSLDNKSWLEYRFYSNERDVFVKLDENNLNAFYSEVWDRPGNSSFHSIIEVLANGKQAEKDELPIIDMDGFIVGLRGFTWKKNASARIVFMNRSGGFSPEIKIKGNETIHIDDQSYECWKVQVGMKGVLGAVFPKSYFWYSVESPHYLVRAEAAGMPGSPKIILEIQSYSVK